MNFSTPSSAKAQTNDSLADQLDADAIAMLTTGCTKMLPTGQKVEVRPNPGQLNWIVQRIAKHPRLGGDTCREMIRLVNAEVTEIRKLGMEQVTPRGEVKRVTPSGAMLKVLSRWAMLAPGLAQSGEEALASQRDANIADHYRAGALRFPVQPVDQPDPLYGT